jgi:hypothetical protein
LTKLSLALDFAVLSILIPGSIVALSNNAHAQADSKITVNTDKEKYEFSYPDPPIVIISGTISRDILSEGEYVVIQVLNPSGRMYRVDFTNVTASDGSFEYHMPIGGPIADISGDYKVLVTYRGNYQSETTFRYDTNSVIADYFCMMRLCTYEIILSNVTHVINYRMTGTITNVTADIESKSLILNVETGTSGGGLRIALPRELIRAENEGNDNSFVVFVDGKETVFEEITEAEQYYSSLDVDQNPEEYRLLSIAFENRVEQIEIVGTWIAPEFSSVAIALVMITSIASIVLWSRWVKVQWKR